MEKPITFLPGKEDSEKKTDSRMTAAIEHSGNSQVDVSVHVDTAPIAFALMYNMYTSKQMSKEEFEEGVRRLKAFQAQRPQKTDWLDAGRFFPRKREA